jgi:hypothetical protein
VVHAKEKAMGYYIERLERHLSKRFPHLRFRVENWSDQEATVFYSPYVEEEDLPIIHRSGDILTDALVDAGLRIWIMPDGAHA